MYVSLRLLNINRMVFRLLFLHHAEVLFSYLPFVKLWARQSHKHTLLCARPFFWSNFVFYFIYWSFTHRKRTFYITKYRKKYMKEALWYIVSIPLYIVRWFCGRSDSDGLSIPTRGRVWKLVWIKLRIKEICFIIIKSC